MSRDNLNEKNEPPVGGENQRPASANKTICSNENTIGQERLLESVFKEDRLHERLSERFEWPNRYGGETDDAWKYYVCPEIRKVWDELPYVAKLAIFIQGNSESFG